ncbi:MAG: hypothetical protein M3416_16890, partial [Acidobacteriota bacterium]|nr:hypothetical protein [Acidobacteriota bacterium]
DQFVRCYCIGQRDVLIMPYDPRKPYLSGEQYVHDPGYLTADVAERVARDVLTLNRALGYDINTVEFAVKDDIPYAIDFMNPAPDAELASVGEFYHRWLVNSVTDLVFRRLGEARPAPQYRWDALLNPPAEPESAAQPLAAAASAAQSSSQSVVESVLPQSVRELPSEVASTVSELVGQAADMVSGIVGAVAGGEPPEPESITAKRTRSTAKKTTAKKSTTPRAKKTPAE